MFFCEPSLCLYPRIPHPKSYRMRKQQWKGEISKLKSLFLKNVFTLAWGGFWFVRKTIDVKNGRWKCIMQINSSKCIKKVMWLCAMGRHNLTNQQTDLIQHLKCSYIHSEMYEQSLSSKFFSIIASQKCLTRLRSQTAVSTSESNDRHHWVSSARSEAQILYYIWKWLYSPAFLNDL